MGILEKLAPRTALRRAEAQKKLELLNSGYDNGGGSRKKKSLSGWIFEGGSAKEDIHDNLPVLRQRSRDLYMTAPLATGAIKTLRTNVVGTGLHLKSKVNYKTLGIEKEQARELERQIEEEFSLWADGTDCDLERFDNFYELQQLACLNWLMSGDVIITLPTTIRPHVLYDLRIHMIEADRVSTPRQHQYTAESKIWDGVEVNGEGEVVAYHIANRHPLSAQGQHTTKWTRVEAYGAATGRKNVIHLMNRERIGQRRGVPFLAPVIESLKQITRYEEAELMAAVVSGMFTVFIEKENATTESAFGDLIQKNQQVDMDESSIELAPGAIFDLNPGEKASTVNPGRPNANFDGFCTAIARQIGSALEIPYELLLKHFTASYSASRGALLEAWKMFRMYRKWLANDFCQAIFEEWMSEAVAKERIKAPGFFSDPLIRRAYTRAEWNGPAQGLLSPVQEVNAALLRINGGLSTHDKESMEINGTSFHQNAEALAIENKIMKEVNEHETNTES